MSKMLSNKKIINEIRQNQQDYVNTRPKMMFKPFVSNRAERDYNLGDRGGYKSLGQNPRYSASINENTAYPDPLLGGGMYKNYLDFNKRYGGAILSEKMPLTGGYYSESSSDSDSEYYDSDSDSDSDIYESDSEYYDSDSDSDSDYEGGGFYDDYVKPAGKALYNVGTEVFKDVVVPVGKEILKNAIIGLMSGAGRMQGGKISGTKDEFIHILRKINPELTKKELNKNTKNKLARKLYQILEIGMHPDDLQTLHYLDALTKNYGQIGGLSGTKKELIAIIKAMYPSIDLKNMTKKDIINEIKKEQPAKEIKVKKEKVIKLPKEPKVKEPKVKVPKVKEPKVKVPKVKVPKVKVPKVKEPKVKEPKEKKPKKTKSKIEKLLKTDEDENKEIEKMFKELEKLDKKDKKLDKESLKLDKYFEKLNKEPKKKVKKPKTTKKVVKEPIKKNTKVKKIVGTKRGERVRGDIVAEVMKKQNLTLPEASKYVKEHNLY